MYDYNTMASNSAIMPFVAVGASLRRHRLDRLQLLSQQRLQATDRLGLLATDDHLHGRLQFPDLPQPVRLLEKPNCLRRQLSIDALLRPAQ